MRTSTIYQFVVEERHEPPTFMKLDVEGAEGRVLTGAEHTLTHARPTLLVDLHTPEQDRCVGDILYRAGYSAFHSADGTRVRDLRTGWPDPNGLWGQIIAFPDAR